MRLDPLFEFLLHPRCCLVRLELSGKKKTQCQEYVALVIPFRDERVATHASDNDIDAEALASAFERNSTLQHLGVGCECRFDAGVCVVCVKCGVWMTMRCDCAREDRVVVFRDVWRRMHQTTTLVSRVRRRLHRRWRGTARCSICMSAVSVAVVLECILCDV
jgi:hypothetical protein